MKAKGRSPVDYFKMFYADTAINGWAPGIRLGLDFFGCDHVMFGTDCPFDPEGGPLFIRELIKAIDSLEPHRGRARQDLPRQHGTVCSS